MSLLAGGFAEDGWCGCAGSELKTAEGGVRWSDSLSRKFTL